MIAIDASASLAWSFRDQQTPALLKLADRVVEQGAIAPQLWPIEVAHVVIRAKRRSQISGQEQDAILAKLSSLDVVIDNQTASQIWQATIMLAIKHNLTVYDATYLELAVRQKLPLATLDSELIVAARAEGLTVLP